MTQQTHQHASSAYKLAAIMPAHGSFSKGGFTDIVGYTAMMTDLLKLSTQIHKIVNSQNIYLVIKLAIKKHKSNI